MSVWSWNAQIVEFQRLLQSLLSAALLAYAVGQFFSSEKSSTAQIVMLSESGELVDLVDESIQWQVTSKSRLAGPFVYLHRVDRFSIRRQTGKWLAKDQFNHSDFRRLCRVIFRCQRNTSTALV